MLPAFRFDSLSFGGGKGECSREAFQFRNECLDRAMCQYQTTTPVNTEADLLTGQESARTSGPTSALGNWPPGEVEDTQDLRSSAERVGGLCWAERVWA